MHLASLALCLVHQFTLEARPGGHGRRKYSIIVPSCVVFTLLKHSKSIRVSFLAPLSLIAKILMNASVHPE